jgi:hypothetical protein
MANYAKAMLGAVARTWRVWLPPIVFAIIIFAGTIVLSGGGETVPLVYRIF